jgi:hypothetical protein
LKVDDVKSEHHKEGECKIWIRIAKERGIDIGGLLNDEYGQLKETFITE